MWTQGFRSCAATANPFELLMLESCRVGASARFWIQVRDDHIPTHRTTSPVVRIDALITSEA